MDYYKYYNILNYAENVVDFYIATNGMSIKEFKSLFAKHGATKEEERRIMSILTILDRRRGLPVTKSRNGFINSQDVLIPTFDSNGNSIPGKLRALTPAEKEFMYDFLEKNNVPVIEATLNGMIRIQRNEDMENAKQKIYK